MTAARPAIPPGIGGALPTLQQPQRVADSVHDLLREAIIEGRITPGSRLSVPLLAQQLSVSRSPVREAVQRLVQEGLAKEQPHRGAAVAKLRPEELVPLYEIREALEGLAARLAAEHAEPDELVVLQAAYEKHASALERGEASRHVALDLSFHAALRAASHSEELQRNLEQVQGKIAIAMLGGRPEEWSKQAIVEHHAILRAVLDRDPDGAEAAARAHIRRVRADIAALIPRRRPSAVD